MNKNLTLNYDINWGAVHNVIALGSDEAFEFNATLLFSSTNDDAVMMLGFVIGTWESRVRGANCECCGTLRVKTEPLRLPV